MYDAVTRNTYAELIKTAEAKMPQQVSLALVKMAARAPAVRDALMRTSSTTLIKEKR